MKGCGEKYARRDLCREKRADCAGALWIKREKLGMRVENLGVCYTIIFPYNHHSIHPEE